MPANVVEFAVTSASAVPTFYHGSGVVVVVIFFTLLVYVMSKVVENDLGTAGILVAFYVFGMAAVFALPWGLLGALVGGAVGIVTGLLVSRFRVVMKVIAIALAKGIFWTAAVLGGFFLAAQIFRVLATAT